MSPRRCITAALHKSAGVGQPECSAPQSAISYARFAELPFEEAVATLTLGLVEALQHAHAKGVPHGCVGTDRILVDIYGRSLLMDFSGEESKGD